MMPGREQPLVVYDGDCDFCRRWVERWRLTTGERVAYAPYQEVAEQFPEVPPERFRTAVVLITPEGEVYSGAEAVFVLLSHVPGCRWPMWAYRTLPGVAPVSEGVYRFVARHRRGFSGLTRLLWGADPAPSTFGLARWFFLRLLAVVYLIAFVSLWTQIHGLVGAKGILPAAELLEAVAGQVGSARYWQLPTICWLDSGDAFLGGLCAIGVAGSLLLLIGFAPKLVLALLWAVYLSLVNVGGAFLSFQWDALLLETSFLAIFLAPATILPRTPSREQVPGAGRWLVWSLLFKLMFLSGVTKLLSGDPTWRELTALGVHYETQPLPTWIGFYAHHLPQWFGRVSVAGMFIFEIGVPFLIMAPRRIRHAAAAALILFQALIAATGNYGFFNLLSVILCVMLLDDQLLARLTPARWVAGKKPAATARSANRLVRRLGWAGAAAVVSVSGLTFLREMTRTQRPDRLPGPVVGFLQRCDQFLLSWGDPYVLEFCDPFRTLNGYGLFRVMTSRRSEIVVEGSDDLLRWEEYELPWKPGDVTRRPRFVQPHQPRLDWQMWFAALDPHRNRYWLNGLMRRILEGSESVLSLFSENPFPDHPPRYVRLSYYQYHFTDLAQKRRSGAWWRRERVGVLVTPLSLPPTEAAEIQE